jgi:hypothetical protein
MPAAPWTPPATPASPAPGKIDPKAIWVPPGISPLPSHMKALVNVIGVSGVGKSYLLAQALDDPDYGPDEVMALMHEDATASYGPKMRPDHILRARTPAEADRIIDRLIVGAREGRRIPKLLGWDSLTGMTDYFQSDKEDNPNMVPVKVDGKATGEWSRDKRSEYGDMGRWGQRLYLKLRDQLPCDVLVMVTSYETDFSPIPEIACEGRVIPKNLTRWSSCTLYMKATPGKIDMDNPEDRKDLEAEVAAGGKPHRSYGRDALGHLNGKFITRYFIAQNTGEIMAKGHRNLAMQEKAILPDILRKIRGEKPRY